jgi:cell division protein ZapB
MLESELKQLEERIQRLNTGYRQTRLELKRALQERDRLLALNSELRRRIEAIVERIRALEESPGSDRAVSDEEIPR